MSGHAFPRDGRDWSLVRAQMQAARAADRPWYHPTMFIGGSYFGGDQVIRIAHEASQLYENCNALYAEKSFPSLISMERELISALLSLLRAPPTAGGSITTGGTESLLLAVHAALQRARDREPRIKAPEIVVPYAAHPAFDKAAHLMGARTLRLPATADYRADVEAVRAAITPSTVMLAASAPSYPYGVTDPIPALGKLCLEHDLWLHVDACHGGFVLPFARALGRIVPEFDFQVEGVTSISVDLHKLGYASKGVSSLLLRDQALGRYQHYYFDAWPAGAYATSGLLGSRGAGGLASAWAVMQSLGECGYTVIVEEILQARDQLLEGLTSLDSVQVLGEPDAYLVAFEGVGVNILAVQEVMQERGWIQGRLTSPPAIHLFLDRSHVDAIDPYLDALTRAIHTVQRSGRRADSADSTYAGPTR